MTVANKKKRWQEVECFLYPPLLAKTNRPMGWQKPGIRHFLEPIAFPKQRGGGKRSRLLPWTRGINASCYFEREMPVAFQLPEAPSPLPGPPVTEMPLINGPRKKKGRPQKKGPSAPHHKKAFYAPKKKAFSRPPKKAFLPSKINPAALLRPPEKALYTQQKRPFYPQK